MKRDTKRQLLERGLDIFCRKGYNNTGIQEVLDAAGVPKGSFYHFFKSKEDFGLQVIEHYAARSSRQMQVYFEDATRTPLTRLRHFFEDGCTLFKTPENARGCFMGNMSQEMGSLSPAFESSLEEKWRRLRSHFASCIRQAREQGEIQNEESPEMLADFLMNGWQGALMRIKVSGCSEPLKVFTTIVFDRVLQPANAPQSV